MFAISYRKILTSVLAFFFAIQLLSALPISYYTETSLLSSGKWIKIKVSTTGIQEITFERLRELGFADPAKVAVYGYSGVDLSDYQFSTAKPDDLPAVPVANYGEKLVFYGVATEVPEEYAWSTSSRYKVTLRRNLNNDCSYYFLTDAYPRLEVVSSDAQALDNLPIVETAHGLVWKNFCERHPESIGGYLFGKNIAEEGKAIYSIHLPGYDDSSNDVPSFSFGVALKAMAGTVEFQAAGKSGIISRRVTVQGYGNDPSHLAYRYRATTCHFDDLAKQEGDIYNVTIDASKSQAPLTEASVDYYAFAYPRNLDASLLPQQCLSFISLQAGQPVKLINSTATTKVWDVSDINSPKEMMIKDFGDVGSCGFISDRDVTLTNVVTGMRAILFDPARELAQVEIVGEVASQNYHGMDVPDMIVVSSDNVYEQALELAELHKEKTGVEVAVVPFREICNEFASGLAHPMALRRFVKMLYDRNPEKLQALLIFGRAFNDNTGLTAIESAEEFAATYIPMLQCDDCSICGEMPKAYSTDAIYGMLSDSFVYDYVVEKGHLLRSPLDIKVGRIPAIDASEASAYLEKARLYIDGLVDVPAYNRAIMTADMGDENLHFAQAKSMRELMAEVAPSTMVDMHMQAVYDPNGKSNENMRRRLTQQLQRGVSTWFFLGHSLTCTEIGSGRLWSNLYDKELKIANPPFVVYGTCQTLVMDTPGPSIQVDMLLNPTGGMIAGVGSTRPVYAQYNVYVTDIMARGYYTQPVGATFGDVYKDGRNLYINDPDAISSGLLNHYGVAVNMMCYNFAGDPMLPMRVPEDNVVVTAFDGKEIDGAMLSVNPLEKYKIEGIVVDDSGEIDTEFSGEVLITIYDGSHTVNSAHNADASNPALSVDLDEDILQEVKIAVENGRFCGDIAFAIPTYQGNTTNRVTLYAVSADKKHSATGRFSDLKVSQSVPAGVEQSSPVISSMYAADETMASNETLPGDFMLYATVDAGETPLLGNSDRLGGSVSLSLDDSRKFVGVDGCMQVALDGTVTIAYPVTGLADGPHTLTLKVVNIAGLSAEKTINVSVVNVAEAQTVVNELFARSGAEIDVEHRFADAPIGRLVITDVTGGVVFSKESVSFPFVWDLTDNQGFDVVDGVYSAKVYFHSGRHYGSAAPASIVVGR